MPLGNRDLNVHPLNRGVVLHKKTLGIGTPINTLSLKGINYISIHTHLLLLRELYVSSSPNSIKLITRLQPNNTSHQHGLLPHVSWSLKLPQKTLYRDTRCRKLFPTSKL